MTLLLRLNRAQCVTQDEVIIGSENNNDSTSSHVLGLCGLYDGTGTGSCLNESKETDTCACKAYHMPKLPPLLGRLLCWFGFHDFRVVDRSFGFGAGGGTEKVECRKCGTTITRRA